MEEGSSFVVRDQRSYLSEEAGQEKKAAPSESSEKPGSQAGKTNSPQTGDSSYDKQAEQAAKKDQIHFSSFILSLGTSALIHLGEERDPATGQKTVAIANAKQVIDLISLLKDKTAGNLSEEEDHLITQLLFTLRMKFIELEKKRSS